MTRIPRARPDVVSRPLGDDEWALYDPTTEQVHQLNLSAAVLWEHCDGTHDAAALARILADHFPDVPAERLTADVDAALGRFETAGLLTWA